MDDDLEAIVSNIRACIVSSKGPTPIRSLSRDYVVLVGSPIPFRQFQYTNLEEFLKSIPSLRVCGSGDHAMVEAAISSASKHISALISRQKSTSKKIAPPPRKSHPPPYFSRGRGGWGRGRGGYSSRPHVSRDHSARDQPSRDYIDSNEPSRDYFARDQQRDYSSRDQSTRDFEADEQTSRDTNSGPRRYSPNFHNRFDANQAGAPLTVKVQGDDKRQVSFRKTNLPPRLQKQKRQSADASPPPLDTAGPQGIEASFFLDQSTSAHSSASIISPLGPSQLIAAGRAMEQAEKVKQQYYKMSSQTSSRGTDDLAVEFARLSHQDGQNQVPQDLSVPPLPGGEVPLPEPDETIIPNNVGVLLRYCLSRSWPVPTYSVLHHKCPDTHRVLYFASVKVNGDGANNFKVGTFPFEHENVNIVKGYAAKKALEKIIEEESKVKADKTISSDTNLICNRISDIVAGASTGMFAKSVEDEYIRRHNELLPQDWLQTVSSWPSVSVESTVNSTIIVPRDPALEQVQFDPTCAPPPLPVDILGHNDGIEDVYITHATSVSNVWFRVIGKEYSEEYLVLLENMDKYYNGVGIHDLALVVEVGQYYAARTLETWFRVCVLEVDDGAKTVLGWLIDHGDNERFSMGTLYRLAPQFCQLPRQAVQCALEGLESFNDDKVANEVVELLIGKSLVAKINEKDKESGFMKVVLFDTSGTDDIEVNEQIKDEIIAKTEPVLPAEGCASEVAIGDVSKKGEVYIMFAGPSLDRITDIIDSLGSDKISEHKLSSFKHITLNKMYLAKYSKDEIWYRAVVTTTPSVQHNKIPVRFVDYGNTESVTISDIADLENLPPILRKLPPQAVKVALHNLPIDTLTNPEVARLHSLLLDEEKVVLIKTVSLKADPPIVEIFTKEAENAALVSVNSTIELQRKLYRNEEKNNQLNVASPEANVNQFLNDQDSFSLKCPDFSDPGFQALLVVLAAHPGNFIFQPVKYGRDLRRLREKMLAYYDAGILLEVPVDSVVKNKLFAARYIDNMWYRVMVTDSPMGTRVPVRLCDYGDVTCVNVPSLRELAPEFHDYPFMAVKGELAGVKPVHKDWSVEDCIRFQGLVVDHVLAGFVVKIKEDNMNPMDMVVALTLVDTSSDKDVDIAGILIQEQRAVRC